MIVISEVYITDLPPIGPIAEVTVVVILRVIWLVLGFNISMEFLLTPNHDYGRDLYHGPRVNSDNYHFRDDDHDGRDVCSLYS